MSLVKNVWVFAEKHNALAELCAGGRQLGEVVTAIVLGSEDEAKQTISWGADRVYWLGMPSSSTMLEDYTETIAGLIKKEQPNLLLVQPSKRAKLMTGRLAAGLATSTLTDAMEINDDNGNIKAKHMVYGGAAFQTDKATTATTIVTVGTGTFSALPEDATRKGAIVAVDYVEPSKKIKLLKKVAKSGVTVNLSAAKRVVGIGRGIANQEDINMVKELAGLIGAEIGCTRPIAEGVNWLPTETYIGVSGVMLKPEFYLALGISGQVQHMVGINQAKTIVAINKDKAAPIFKQADYGIVGDLYKVVPALIDKFRTNM